MDIYLKKLALGLAMLFAAKNVTHCSEPTMVISRQQKTVNALGVLGDLGEIEARIAGKATNFDEFAKKRVKELRKIGLTLTTQATQKCTTTAGASSLSHTPSEQERKAKMSVSSAREVQNLANLYSQMARIYTQNLE